jgi:hypothetical protein
VKLIYLRGRPKPSTSASTTTKRSFGQKVDAGEKNLHRNQWWKRKRDKADKVAGMRIYKFSQQKTNNSFKKEEMNRELFSSA